MTVLLIDGVGRALEWEVPAIVPELLFPRRVPVNVVLGDAFNLPPLSALVTRFRLSDELSWPPVYRLVPDE